MVWLGLRESTQFCCSLSRVPVSSGPFSGTGAFVVGRGLEEWGDVKAAWGLGEHVWDSEAWLVAGGASCGRHWLGLRLVFGTVRPPGGVGCVPEGGLLKGGVARGSGERFPGGVTGGSEEEMSRRI